MTTFEMLFKLATEPGEIFDSAREMANPAVIALLMVQCAFKDTTAEADVEATAKLFDLKDRAARNRIENTYIKNASSVQ